jgi:hypothetical protein
MKYILLAWPLLAVLTPSSAQTRGQHVRFHDDARTSRISVEIGNRPFTAYWYGDTLAKPILFPVRTASGHTVTRGFPIAPRPGERTDHPHQAGIWFTFEDVNGLDFWNNSYAVTGERRQHLGWIRQDSVLEMKDGTPGVLTVRTYWENPRGERLLREVTRFVFSGDRHSRQIDRTTTLTALVPVTFHDRKDGLLGMRVASALEMPSTPGLEAMTGNRSGRPLNPSSPANGNYLSSTGLQGDSVWGSRARWCMLYGSQGSETESITIFDHPGNPGYPTYWHARGYGLFAANPLAPSAFDKKADSMNFHLDTGAAATFRYRILITDGRDHPRAEMLNRIADDFGKQ